MREAGSRLLGYLGLGVGRVVATAAAFAPSASRRRLGFAASTHSRNYSFYFCQIDISGTYTDIRESEGPPEPTGGVTGSLV